MRLPNYKLRYGILLSICEDTNTSKIDATLFSREYRCSRNTIYRTVENVMKDVHDVDNAIYKMHKSIPKFGDTINKIPSMPKSDIIMFPKNILDESIKQDIRDRDKHMCVICKQKESENRYTLNVHHINWDWKDNEPNNLISLCSRCHRVVHKSESKEYYRNQLENIING